MGESKQYTEFDVDVNGASLHVRQLNFSDSNPTIVFLHDSLGSIKLWRDFPNRLCSSTQCNGIVYDRQGYGESAPFSSQSRDLDYLEKEADVLIVLLKQLGIRRSVLFGHSDGGSIALLAAAKDPSLIFAVISEGAHVFVEEITLEGIRNGQEQYATTNLREKLIRYHGDKTNGVFSAWADTWLQPKFKEFNMENFLPQIKCPVMAIQGVLDEYGSEAQVDSIVGKVDGVSQKFMVPDVGHTPHRDAAEVVIEKVTEFICLTQGFEASE